jgi:hypothetical protein
MREREPDELAYLDIKDAEITLRDLDVPLGMLGDAYDSVEYLAMRVAESHSTERPEHEDAISEITRRLSDEFDRLRELLRASGSGG